VTKEETRADESPARFVNATPKTLLDVIGLIREDYETFRGDRSRPGFRALLVYRIDSWRLGLKNRFVRLPFTFACRVAARWIRKHYSIELPPTAQIGRRLFILHSGGVVVHMFATIGDDCVLHQRVTIGGAGKVSRDRAPRIGNGVKIGAGAAIIGDVRVGDRANIGPNAVVTMDVPDDATAFAAPARVIFAPSVDDR